MRIKIGHSKVTSEATPNRPGLWNAHMAAIGNIQFGILFKYADGVTDFYVYDDETEFKRHAKDFKLHVKTNGGIVLWSSQKI